MNVQNRPWLLGVALLLGCAVGAAQVLAQAPVPASQSRPRAQGQPPAQPRSESLPQPQSQSQSPRLLPLPADSAPRELLNSERIQTAFGSYGIEVLENTAAVRVSNLYSGAAETRIGRTFAIVRYASDIAPQIVSEHDAIVRGGSIGAVFQTSGWRVVKTHLYFGTLAAGSRSAELMRVPEGRALAAHVYVLEVEKDGRRFPYATLAELHHPGYLVVDDLARIYGRADASGRETVVAEMLEIAAEKSQSALPQPARVH